jgi:isoquinoline 1-oxidoreductase beta subunit
LRHVPAHPERHPEGEGVSTTRRDFLRITACAGGALMIGFDLYAAEKVKPFRPNAWIAVEPDGAIVLTVGKTEMGQGVRTALPMILAEELEADWSKIRIVQAEPSPDFKRLGTGGSFSIAGLWTPLRIAGAAAREMLIAAGAAKWGVDAATCIARDSVVVHRRADAARRTASSPPLRRSCRCRKSRRSGA